MCQSACVRERDSIVCVCVRERERELVCPREYVHARLSVRVHCLSVRVHACLSVCPRKYVHASGNYARAHGPHAQLLVVWKGGAGFPGVCIVKRGVRSRHVKPGDHLGDNRKQSRQHPPAHPLALGTGGGGGGGVLAWVRATRENGTKAEPGVVVRFTTVIVFIFKLWCHSDILFAVCTGAWARKEGGRERGGRLVFGIQETTELCRRSSAWNQRFSLQ